MSNNFLSQEEINALLSGESTDSEDSNVSSSGSENMEDAITETDKDLLGEIGNISMGSASTALYQLINQQVNITTPVVSVTTLKEIKEGFETPNIVLDIEYIAGIVGRNILIIKTYDGLVISNLMMGGDGKVTDVHELSELEISAVSEAMNQMIGSAATSMATMFGRKVDISPPTSKVVTDDLVPISDSIPEDQPIVKVSFKMTIGDIVDSNIMQIFPIETAKNIVAIMTGEDSGDKTNEQQPEKPKEEPIVNKEIHTQPEPQIQQTVSEQQMQYEQPQMQMQQQQYAPQQQMQGYGQPQMQSYMQQPQMYGGGQVQQYAQPVEVHQAAFEPLTPQNSVPPIKNIDLIMDVPLDISVVLGRTKKSIQDILNLGAGSLIELDKLAEEPVEILVNGKQIALGEVVVVDENFGVRITSIVSNVERLKSLK
ncbi:MULTISPECIES: flagellar motor switch phosphatase FliY [Clostridium]|uniref:Flagellar motor switch phosphatase FliY n=2 Tax=Clostridiaceae TaxID=31979 RepID=A0AAP9RGA5_CLOBU|nr:MULTISPECIES: flagellar motor switch phosphatase FliY [Clostridium]AXB85923.1 flagellar motor switch phosphatase FliY [Clostridium butyricum]MBZ5745169.1 flagellar motor switch phosphatase FliY [Clostridium butyricum]MCQ2018576.1 flagellar motor switch phosphatase FliY [Clostridium butyricum]MCQ2026299.1 flagellar motor switch phosphatase FliY [Clostridium butyricum]MDB2136450.1 flagellar motor switch phosphatase FliY [Clostridium butyricum]